MCMLINFKRTYNGFKQWNSYILRWKKYSISQGCNVFDFDVSTYIKIKKYSMNQACLICIDDLNTYILCKSRLAVIKF